MMKSAIFIQARMGATRLPSKMIIPFYKGKGIFEIIIERIKETCKLPIVLVTSSNKENNQLVEIAKQNDIFSFQGSEENVLNRFIEAAKQFEVQHIYRVCADNPFLDIQRLNKLISINKNKDYISFLVNSSPSITTHYGFWSEYLNFNTLVKISNLTTEKIYQEHVTNYIYEHKSKFSILWLNEQSFLNPAIRTTVDTQSDFDLSSKIYSESIEKGEELSLNSVIRYINKNKYLLDKMKLNIESNRK